MPRSCVPAQQAPIAAYAFRAEVTKWLALVRLLLSDIPERAELAAPGLATALQPYFHLTNAVRTGSLATFQCVFTAHHSCAADQAATSVCPLPAARPFLSPWVLQGLRLTSACYEAN